MNKKPFVPVPLLTPAEVEQHRRAMRLVSILLYVVGLPLLFIILWFALR
jgi:hypothetical protein